jgi:hypothetical protein
MPSFTGVAVDGRPARLIASDDPTRVRFMPDVGGLDVEFVARDVPAFGCRRFALTPAEPAPDTVDVGFEISAGDVRVRAEDDGTLTIALGDRTFSGLFGIEDCVDRGDSYDADPDEPRPIPVLRYDVVRTRHACGIERLRVTRELGLIGTLIVDACVAPGVPSVRCDVTIDNQAPDHRLRLRFPAGAHVDTFDAATTLDVAHRSTTPPDDTDWVHRAPRTFPHQGWIAAQGLVVGAPGLPEGEVTEDGEILVSLVRSVGKLARITLRTRPMPAAPEMPAPGAQVLEPVTATITIATDPRDVRAAEVGLWGVLGDDAPLLADGVSLLAFDARDSELSACKPADDIDRDIIVRVLNPTDAPDSATLRLGFDVARATAARLDETPVDQPLEHIGRTITFPVPPHALRTVRITPSGDTT